MAKNSLVVLAKELEQLPFTIQTQLADLPAQAREDFLYEYKKEKKDSLIAYIAHFSTLSEGYLNNWTLQILFWLACCTFFLGGAWWVINLFRLPRKVKKHNQKLAHKILKQIHYKYQIAGGQKAQKTKAFKNPKQLLKKAPLPTPRAWKPIDPDTYTLESLQNGFLVDHLVETFEVVNHFQYDWGDITSEKLYKLNEVGGLDSFSLMLQREGNTMAIYKVNPVNIYALKEDLDKEIKEFKRPSNIIKFQGNTFFREYGKAGWAFDIGIGRNPLSQEVVAWKYFDESRRHIIRIELHGEKDFKAFIGQSVSPVEFPNIMPQ